MDGFFHFNKVSASDLPSIIALEEASYPADEAATPEKLHYRAEHAADLFWVLKHSSSPSSPDKAVIGFICATSAEDSLTHDTMSVHVPGGAVCCIHSVVITEELRGKGLATLMMQHYLTRLPASIKRCMLLAHADKAGLYERCGFQSAGLSEVVHGSQPWLEMSLSLPAHPSAHGGAPAAAAQKQLPFFRINAFGLKGQRFSGNPACVVLLPPAAATEQGISTSGSSSSLMSLPASALQPFAQEMNAPATVFVQLAAAAAAGLSPPLNTFRVRFFTPDAEIPFCGHASLAAAAALLKHSSSKGAAASAGAIVGTPVPPPSLPPCCKQIQFLTSSSQSIIITQAVAAYNGTATEVELQLELAQDPVLSSVLPGSAVATTAGASADAASTAASAAFSSQAEALLHGFGLSSSTSTAVVRSIHHTARDMLVELEGCHGGAVERAKPSLAALRAAFPGIRIISLTSRLQKGAAGGAAAEGAAAGPTLSSVDSLKPAFKSRCFNLLAARSDADVEDAACGAAHCALAPFWKANGCPAVAVEGSGAADAGEWRWLRAAQLSARGGEFVIGLPAAAAGPASAGGAAAGAGSVDLSVVLQGRAFFACQGSVPAELFQS